MLIGVLSLLEASAKGNEEAPLLASVPLVDQYAVGYAASKWAGEHLLHRAAEEFAFPVNILRGKQENGEVTGLVAAFVVEPFQGKTSIVTWTREETAGGTRPMMTHEGVAEAAGEAATFMLTAFDNGWESHGACHQRGGKTVQQSACEQPPHDE